jgi:NADH:ubiquinone oxidoreductase subunit H
LYYRMSVCAQYICWYCNRTQWSCECLTPQFTIFQICRGSFLQYVSYVVVVSFIGGWNMSTETKLPTCLYVWYKYIPFVSYLLFILFVFFLICDLNTSTSDVSFDQFIWFVIHNHGWHICEVCTPQRGKTRIYL